MYFTTRIRYFFYKQKIADARRIPPIEICTYMHIYKYDCARMAVAHGNLSVSVVV